MLIARIRYVAGIIKGNAVFVIPARRQAGLIKETPVYPELKSAFRNRIMRSLIINLFTKDAVQVFELQKDLCTLNFEVHKKISERVAVCFYRILQIEN